MSVIEKNIRKTNIQRILHTLCLILPVAAAFGGYFAAPYIWAQLKNNETTELLKSEVLQIKRQTNQLHVLWQVY